MNPPKRRLDEMRESLWVTRYSYRSEQVYLS